MVNGDPIFGYDVDGSLAVALGLLEAQAYSLRLAEIDRVIGERLFADAARRRGLTIQQLEQDEVIRNANDVTDADVEQIIRWNTTPGVTLEELRQETRRALEQRRRDERRRAFIDTLRRAATVRVLLRPSLSHRATLSVGGSTLNQRSTTVHLVEFLDYLCRHCRSFQPVLQDLSRKYGTALELEIRHFPITRRSRTVARAAWCAGQANRFWEYHRQLLTTIPTADLSVLVALGIDVGLDGAALAQCIASKRAHEAVERDMSEARRLGVGSTPTLFINGAPFVGLWPADALTRVIDHEIGAGQSHD